ncbi:MAG: carbohydrate porin, partial [Endomicrobium sp.]|nr:carbohydrate porin [Endomicrobium sp.]
EYLHVKISKLFYETILFSDKLTITVGKIGFFSFFANNIYTGNTNKQFINEAFVKDKSIDIPKGTYALRLNYIYSKNFYVDLGCYAAENNVSLKGLKIIQITYNPYDAHYRLYYWVNDKKTQDLTSHGLGMSIDKLIFSKLGLFLRCSYKYPFTTIYLLNKHEKIPLFFLYSCGVQFTAFRSRLNDVIGFAIGQSYNHIEYSLYNTNKNKSLLLETQIETYYNYQLNNYVTISPTIQLIRNQHRENPHKRLFVYGIKINIVLF